MPSLTRMVVTSGREQKVEKQWFRGEHCNYAPVRATLRKLRAVDEYILEGWLPKEPFITPDTKVASFGSCFADNIARHLNHRKYTVLTKSERNAYVVKLGEGLVNSFAIRSQFDWALRGITPKVADLWHGWKAESQPYDESVRVATKELFEQTDVFVLTFGLSEIWYDEPTGEAFWRAIPARLYDPERHKFRVSSVDENKANLHAIYRTIREFRPDARVIVTLSPVPLVATFRPVSAITATSVSKAVLRAAIDEFYREVDEPERLYYWPSYEIVLDGFGTGKWHPDNRHVIQPVLDYIMALFETYYCHGSAPEHSLTHLQVLAMEATGDLPAGALEAARTSDLDSFDRWVRERLSEDDRETAELMLTYARELDQTHAAYELPAPEPPQVPPARRGLMGRLRRS